MAFNRDKPEYNTRPLSEEMRDNFRALAEHHRDTAAPNDPQPGYIWWDASNSSNEKLRAYTGTEWLDLFEHMESEPVPATGAGLSYQGTWNAQTNSPMLTSGVGSKGEYYVVSVAGSTDLDGVTDWQIGDWAIFNGTAWQKIDNSAIVTSVFGRIGAVVSAEGDYAASQIDNDSGVTGSHVSDALDQLDADKQDESEKAQADGYASLDGSGKVPTSQIPTSLIGAVSYQGTWNANTNDPTLASGVGTKGHYYVVSVAGNTNLDGITDWLLGDWAIFNGSVWEKVDNTETVNSVFGRTGAVTAQANDYTHAQLDAIGANDHHNQVHGLGSSDHNDTTISGLNAKISDGDFVKLAGQIGGTAAVPDVRGIRTTTGPTLLTVGAIADGQLMQRSGSSVIGVAAGGKLTAGNDWMTASATAADGDQACATAIAAAPAGDLKVLVNGVQVPLGDAVKTTHCYFSRDGGTTALAKSALTTSDVLYWNGSRAGYQLSVVDRVTFVYEV